MWKKWRGSPQAPTLYGISHEHYAVHATQLFLTGQVYPTLMSSVPHAWDKLDRKRTLFKLIAKFFLKGVVFMFWHDNVCIELLYCLTNFELVWTWNKVAVVENAKKRPLYPTFPYMLANSLGWNHGRNFVVKCVGDSLMWNQYSHRPDSEVKFCKYRFPIMFLEVFSKQH